MAEQTIQPEAVLSPCGTYRYYLGRTWDHDLPRFRVVMLNPSTADEWTDDPTIRRCISFAAREGCGALHVCNLFAYRATKPTALKDVSPAERVGPENHTHLQALVSQRFRYGAGPLVVAWGAHRIARDRAVLLLNLARSQGVTLWCLGRTADGSPRRLLYVRGDQPLEVWS